MKGDVFRGAWNRARSGMPQVPKILWIGEGGGPTPNVRQAVGGQWEFSHASSARPLAEQLKNVSVAMLRLNDSAGNVQKLMLLLDEVAGTDTIVLVLLPEHARMARRIITERQSQFMCVNETAPAKDLAAMIGAATELQPALRSLRKELVNVRRQRLNTEHVLEEIDEQLRLAARIQRDFLPRRLPEVGPVRFGVLYRPFSWVSGDIYDIARLDESHVYLYVADAVGHGMPAALLTMFIDRALESKRISGQRYEIIPPGQSLALLNTEMNDQNLSSSQFCTAVYGVLDVSTLRLTYARAGHPAPIIRRVDGTLEMMSVPGTLLGVFPGVEFAEDTVQLQRGDRVLFYTDGAEEALRPATASHDMPFIDVIRPWMGLECVELLRNVDARLERQHVQNLVDDDVTLVVMDVEQG